MALNDTPTSETSKNFVNLTNSIVGLGNPLLDISANVPEEVLTKYKIKLDNAMLAEEHHLPLYNELIEKYNADFVAGGATQNSIRVAQWMLKDYNDSATTFFGSVGVDAHADRLKDCAKKDGVKTYYLEHADTPTGTCAVCVKDGERSLVANLSAANKFVHDHLEKPHCIDAIQQARFYYSAGFHLTVSPPAIMKLAEHASDNNKIFMLNLSADFIVNFFKDPLLATIPHCDYIFGNELESTAFGKSMGWGEDLKEIASKLASMPKSSGARARTVVFTQGAKPTIVFSQGKIIEFSVPELNQDEIVDTNGAGDAFVGGFLSQLVLEKSLEECVDAGHWAAQVVIRQSGCTYPSVCDYVKK